MILNYIWIGFFVIGFLVGMIKLLNGDIGVFQEMINGIFSAAETSVIDLAIPLIGVMAFWLGIMRVGEKAGVIESFSRLISPIFSIIFKDIPKGHSANSSIALNFSANMLGLDNAATPFGLKAMGDLQGLNPKPKTATDSMIMFLVLNTSSLTLIPTSVMAMRYAAGAENPTDIFLPILIATAISSFVGMIITALSQKIFNERFIVFCLGLASIMGLIIYSLYEMDPGNRENLSKVLAGTIISGFIMLFLGMALIRKVNAFEEFVDGAKEGFTVAIKIIPYLVAMLCAIAVFKASGAMEYMTKGLEWLFSLFFSDTRFTEGIPTALMKPLSGSGARAMMVESWGCVDGSVEMGCKYVDTFGGKLTSIIQGSTETTFYVLAVYFGSVGIKNTRNAVVLGLIADLAGIIAAIVMAYLFFG